LQYLVPPPSAFVTAQATLKKGGADEEQAAELVALAFRAVQRAQESIELVGRDPIQLAMVPEVSAYMTAVNSWLQSSSATPPADAYREAQKALESAILCVTSSDKQRTQRMRQAGVAMCDLLGEDPVAVRRLLRDDVRTFSGSVVCSATNELIKRVREATTSVKTVQIPIDKITGIEPVDDAIIDELADSIAVNGLQQFPVVLGDLHINSGRKRVLACRKLGWPSIQVVVRDDLEGDRAELAELDENLVRRSHGPLELAEMLARKKAAYERLFPDVAHGKASPKTSKEERRASFAKDMASKCGMSERSVQELIQIATDIDEGAKVQLQGTSIAGERKQLLRVAREKDKKKQVEVARLIADKEANTVGAAFKILKGDDEPAVDDENAEPKVTLIDPSESRDIPVTRRGKARVARIRIGEQLIELRLERNQIRWVPLSA